MRARGRVSPEWGVDSGGTYHRAIFEREVVGELVTEIGGDGVVARERAVIGGSRGEHDVGAELHIAVIGGEKDGIAS